MSAPDPGPRPEAIAVHADLYRSDARVRRVVVGALTEGLAEVRLWGGQDTAGAGRGPGSVRHELSVAARAFKAQALAAASVPAAPGEVAEVFRRGEVPGLAHRQLRTV